MYCMSRVRDVLTMKTVWCKCFTARSYSWRRRGVLTLIRRFEIKLDVYDNRSSARGESQQRELPSITATRSVASSATDVQTYA